MSLTDRYLAFRDRHPDSRKVFVIGSGRSGTHWIGYVLDSHPRVSATIEKPSIFNRVTTAATNPPARASQLSQLIPRYRWEHAKVAPNHYVDKSHPNIWLVEDLSFAFPNALFVGIRRNPYATVASMLEHGGVRKWVENWQQLPQPNPFLGIGAGQSDYYASLSITARCALRWLSHSQRLDALENAYPDSLMVVEYEDLMRDAKSVLDQLRTFLELDEPFPLPPINRGSSSKWVARLTPADIDDIAAITGAGRPGPPRSGDDPDSD